MKGYDVFFESPGAVQEHACLVCGTTCLVERNKVGPTGWVAAAAKKVVEHDYFYCPNKSQPWHEQALELVQAIEETPSKRIAALMQMDLAELLKENGIELPKWMAA